MDSAVMDILIKIADIVLLFIIAYYIIKNAVKNAIIEANKHCIQANDTNNNVDKLAQSKCPKCKKLYDIDFPKCPHCGAPNAIFYQEPSNKDID